VNLLSENKLSFTLRFISKQNNWLMLKAFELPLDGSADDLAALFSYTKEEQDSNLSSLESYLAHAFNQTLVRDHYYGAWAQVLQQDGKYVLKMFSPHHDLRIYERLITDWIAAGKVGLTIFQANQSLIPPESKNDMQFLLPFGLSMAKSRSVQLLHFPPLETFVFQDYLYSPTNRRWENLMGYNEIRGINFAELETIVDCVPIAAPGDDSKGIAPFNNLFTPYVKKMLQARLTSDGKFTQPVVAYGEPVMQWVRQAFPDVVKDELQPLSLIEISLFDNDVITPLLCANHPSKYLYYTDQPYSQEKENIMLQDLIAAGWQATMAYYPERSAAEVLQEMSDAWTNSPDIRNIMDKEDQAYGYKL
jgi:hypothetical protein